MNICRSWYQWPTGWKRNKENASKLTMVHFILFSESFVRQCLRPQIYCKPCPQVTISTIPYCRVLWCSIPAGFIISVGPQSWQYIQARFVSSSLIGGLNLSSPWVMMFILHSELPLFLQIAMNGDFQEYFNPGWRLWGLELFFGITDPGEIMFLSNCICYIWIFHQMAKIW